MAEIERKFKCNCKEASIVHNGVSYLVICGKHINGAYCAFPKLNIAAELSGYDDDYSYNKKKLRLAVSDNNEINEETAAALSIVITDIIAYNEKLKTHQYDLLINEHSYQQASLNLYDYGVPNNIYGYISAASIEMELPIYLGATEDNMAFGAAHLTNTSLPIGGESTNCVLAAHTGYIGRVFFDYIRYLNIGDEITITNFWDTSTYKVTDKQIYKKYESSKCYITEGKDLLTLITCAHGGADRYYVLCERVDNLSTD